MKAAVPKPVLGVLWRAWVAKATYTCSSLGPGMLLLPWLTEMCLKVGRELRWLYPYSCVRSAARRSSPTGLEARWGRIRLPRQQG